MRLIKVGILGLLVAMAASCAVCDTVVYQEDFSAPFVQHDWVYNNSGNNNVTGYPGNIGGLTQFWPAKISDDGHEVLGYSPLRYYGTSFEEFTIGPLSGQDHRGWVGSGTIGTAAYGAAQGISFTSQSAYRNVTSSMTRSVQYVQCYVRSSSTGAGAYVYAGTENLGSIAAAVRLNNSGQIEALNGDGVGGGTWVVLANYAADQWNRITIKLDYGTNTYRAAVQGGYNDTDLGFRDSAAAAPGFQAIGLAETSGIATFFVDDVYTGNSPYAPGYKDGELKDYWTDSYNRWCIDYGGPLHDTRDAYDWMSCSDLSGNPVNTDTYPTDLIPGSKAPPYKATLPAGWTAAFNPWGDQEPQLYAASGRGKMGFTRLKGAYAQEPDNPCLHIWSSQGDMRVVLPNISTGPGAYTLTWKGSVWNLNTADPSQQHLWTDFCSWGFGYTNWCVWDPWTANQGFLQTLPPFAKDLNWMGISEYWQWPFSPFQTTDPHPAGEEPGEWHTFTNTFAFGLCPDKLPTGVFGKTGFYPGPGYFAGFRVSHAHDSWNNGYQWGTILNVDDIVVTKKDPVEVVVARNSPVDTLVEVANLVVVNMVCDPGFEPGSGNFPEYVEVFLEKQDRSAGILVRVEGDMTATVFDNNLGQFRFQLGQVVRAIGAISKDDPYYTRVPQPDTQNPLAYIAKWSGGSYFPAIIATGAPQVDLKPVIINNKGLAGNPVARGLGTEAMLVNVFGRVNHSDQLANKYFYLDDGSGLAAGKPELDSTTNATGVRIDCRAALNFTCPPDGSYVVVTGTYTAEKRNPADHTTVVRVVYPRSADDILTYTD